MARWTCKDFAIIVAAGVVTAVTIEFALKFLRDQAIISARSEVQKLILAAQPLQQNNPQEPVHA